MACWYGLWMSNVSRLPILVERQYLLTKLVYYVQPYSPLRESTIDAGRGGRAIWCIRWNGSWNGCKYRLYVDISLLAYGSWWILIYLSMYYCSVHAYFPNHPHCNLSWPHKFKMTRPRGAYTSHRLFIPVVCVWQSTLQIWSFLFFFAHFSACIRLHMTRVHQRFYHGLQFTCRSAHVTHNLVNLNICSFKNRQYTRLSSCASLHM